MFRFIAQHSAQFHSVEALALELKRRLGGQAVHFVIPKPNFDIRHKWQVGNFRSKLKELGWDAEMMDPIEAHTFSGIELSPYIFSKQIPPKIGPRFRYSYGMAKEAWLLRESNLEAYDRVFTNGPAHTALIGSPKAWQVGNLRFGDSARNALSGQDRVLFFPTLRDSLLLKNLNQLTAAIPTGVTAALKPHPMTKYLSPFAWFKLNRFDITILDADLDIYREIRKSDIVVSDISGAVFDSILIAKRTIVVTKSKERIEDRLLRSAAQTGAVTLIEKPSELGPLVTSFSYHARRPDTPADQSSLLPDRKVLIGSLADSLEKIAHEGLEQHAFD